MNSRASGVAVNVDDTRANEGFECARKRNLHSYEYDYPGLIQLKISDIPFLKDLSESGSVHTSAPP